MSWQKHARGLRSAEQMAARGWLPPEAAKALDHQRVKSGLLDFKVPEALHSAIDGGCQQLARQFVPDLRELDVHSLELEDPIGDETFSPVPGLTHRYPDRVLLKPSYHCACYCRFCFRRYKVSDPRHNLSPIQLTQALAYVESHSEVREVILSGGDPLALGDEVLGSLLARLDRIAHVELLRLHTRIPTVLPQRITDALAKQLSSLRATVWIVAHINSAAELAPEADLALKRLTGAGLPVLAQSVLLKGINADLPSLTELLRALIRRRLKPYYLHYPDLARGTRHFRIPLDEAVELVRALRGKLPGYALPRLMIDLPGGGGKIPVDESWIIERRGANEFVAVSPLSGEKIKLIYPSEDEQPLPPESGS